LPDSRVQQAHGYEQYLRAFLMAHKESALLRAFQFRRTSTAISWYSHQKRGHGAGESNYVQKQMGHKSIQITIDVYGHLIPGENVAWIDTLDKTPQKVTATDAHQPHTQRIGRRDFKGWAKYRSRRSYLAAPQGFEPRYADPESAVLPLNEGAECVDS
jgi:hypothetical protein